jgi:hypothetical protein
MQENHSHAGIQRRACDLRACDIFSRAINNQAAAWHILISTLSPCLYKETKASGLGHGKKKGRPRQTAERSTQTQRSLHAGIFRR